MEEKGKIPDTEKEDVSSRNEGDKNPQKYGEDSEERYSSYFNPYIQRSLLGLYGENIDWFYMQRIL